MSKKIDNLTNSLLDNLSDIDDRLSSVKITIESAPKETQAKIESKPNEVKSILATKRRAFNAYRTKLKELGEERETEVKSKVEEWKIEELNRQADRADNYAASRIVFAIAAIDEAEDAILGAIGARFRCR